MTNIKYLLKKLVSTPMMMKALPAEKLLTAMTEKMETMQEEIDDLKAGDK